MGYEQTYISALEVGAKGPPTPEFVEKLVTVLELDRTEEERLRTAVDASQRKMILEVDSSPEAYWLMKDLRDRIHGLHPVQIKMISEILQLPESLQARTALPPRRRKRRTTEEARM